ncbi:transposase [Chroococcidiopsis sp. FACHB-1243]|uniref:transposase n=1 Tax=Chroococcidiopsis sp. [FACHB-1243] TaxID=2692781 RepID=UPI00177F43EE|nr:transposase [Chroococcidiopsis sp. [FACHB-1243]]MBD2308062.1 transposase [Chroococcidiopsis sp. [FACHB-1243]]
MTYDPIKHNRHSIRLQNYDYSASGAYFITICTYQRDCLFGEITDGVMQINQLGKVARSHWMNLNKHHLNLDLDAFVIMPNHLHGILILSGDRYGRAGFDRELSVTTEILSGDRYGRAGFDRESSATTEILSAKPVPTGISGMQSAFAHQQNSKCHAVPDIIRGFKTFSAREINRIRRISKVPVWQRNYYEHIIRNEESLERIRDYIDRNPMSWYLDKLHPDDPSRP